MLKNYRGSSSNLKTTLLPVYLAPGVGLNTPRAKVNAKAPSPQQLHVVVPRLWKFPRWMNLVDPREPVTIARSALHIPETIAPSLTREVMPEKGPTTHVCSTDRCPQ